MLLGLRGIDYVTESSWTDGDCVKKDVRMFRLVMCSDVFCSAGRKVPNVIIDKKGQSDDDDDDDDDTAGDKNDFLGRGDAGNDNSDDLLLQPKPTSQQDDDVNGEVEGDDNHG